MSKWLVEKEKVSIRKRVLFFLSTIVLLFVVSNIYSIYSEHQVQKEFDRILDRYYTINRFMISFSNGITLYEQYLDDRTDSNWVAYTSNEETVEKIIHEIMRDAQELPMDTYLLTQSVKNTYAAYGEVIERGDGAISQKEHLDEVYTIAELIDESARQLLQTNMTHGFETYDKLSAAIELRKLVSIDLMVLVAIAAVWFAFFILDRVLNPMVHLAENVKAVEREEFDIPDLPVQGQDEVSQMNRSFNSMKVRMRNIIAQLKEKQELSEKLHEREMAVIQQEKMMEQAKLSYLQSQINPHFLFNTLNVISSMARKERAKDTNELILSLGRIFRYNLKNESQLVPLSKELTVIKSYVYIEKKRFGDRLNYIVRADLDLECCFVPPFTLQPLVENSMKHGILHKDEGGFVALKICQSEENVIIRVLDSGAGMEQDQKDALLHGRKFAKAGGEASGIGIGNVFGRLKLVYPECRIQIISRKGRGTCIEIRIKKGECMHEKGFDCR
ncbi:MAG: histidine kinase [Lachnospiraceae bacterium]|nr:histidine kinase [Lachnospiraceae bacterium]